MYTSIRSKLSRCIYCQSKINIFPWGFMVSGWNGYILRVEIYLSLQKSFIFSFSMGEKKQNILFKFFTKFIYPFFLNFTGLLTYSYLMLIISVPSRNMLRTIFRNWRSSDGRMVYFRFVYRSLWSYFCLKTFTFLADLISSGPVVYSNFEFFGFRLNMSADCLVWRSLVSATCRYLSKSDHGFIFCHFMFWQNVPKSIAATDE